MPDAAAPQVVDVLAVAPHPDDLEILCGGTLAKLVKQGQRVALCDLTSGEPTPRGSLEIRRKEADAARQILGVPQRLNLDLPNRVLMDCPENRFLVGTLIRKLRPKVIVTMAGRTPAASPDHHQGHLLVEAARFYAQLTKWDDKFGGMPPYRVPHLVYACVPFDAEQRHWHGTFVVDISDTMEQKLAAIRAYESQFDPDRYQRVEHFIRSYCGLQGARCGFMYGELFALPHPVGTEDFYHLVNGGKGSIAPVQLPGHAHLPMN